MANLTITVPDNTVTRIKAAFGHWDLVNTNQWVPATNQDLVDLLKQHIREQVAGYEARLAAQSTVDNVSKEAW